MPWMSPRANTSCILQGWLVCEYIPVPPDNLPEDAQTLGKAVAVEHRYIGDIVAGMKADGLVVGRG